jgi:hypothetical protein
MHTVNHIIYLTMENGEIYTVLSVIIAAFLLSMILATSLFCVQCEGDIVEIGKNNMQ